MSDKKITLKNRKTFVFVDVSNIRYACRCSCSFDLNFRKFYRYLRGKYANLQEVRYYEGIASDDEKKTTIFSKARKSWLYDLCARAKKLY